MPDGSTITVSNEEDWDAIKDWYDTNPDSEEKPEMQFPVNVEFDDEIVTVNSEEELRELKQECWLDENDKRECFYLVFPVTYIMPDGSTITVETKDDDAGWQLIKNWYDANPDSDERPTLQFPVDITYETEDGDTTLTVNNDEEMNYVKSRCREDWADGDSEEDEECYEFVLPISFTMPDGTTITIENEEDWYNLRPNTDVAVMLAMAYHLLVEDLHDGYFLDKYTVGFEIFQAYLLGQKDGVPKTPAWAASISGMAEADIISLTREMTSKRTMLTVSWSLTRQQYGEQPFWAATALAAMLGQMGKPGGGIAYGYTITNYLGNNVFKMPYAPLPQKKNSIADFIPVARVSDMLLNPGQKFDYDGKEYIYPDIDLIYWAGGNPFHHHQNLSRLRKAWEKPSTVIVNEWCWNALARHADIILPCTTTLERQDIGMTPVSYTHLTLPTKRIV